MKNKYLFLFLTIITLHTYAQKGSVFLNVKPDSSIVKINGETFNNLETFELDTGKHFLEAWNANKKRYYNSTFTLKDGEFKKMDIYLSQSAYATDLRKYQNRMFEYKFFPKFLFVAAFTTSTYYIYRLDKNINEKYIETMEYKSNYDNAVSVNSTDYYRLRFYKNKTEYEDMIRFRNKVFVSSVIINGALLTYCIFAHKKSLVYKKPVFTKTLMYSDLLIFPSYHQNTFGLTLNLSMR
jgi:hypothetical protein